MKNLLIVSNCPSDATRAIQQAVASGAQHADINGVKVVVKEPLQADAQDVLSADGVLLGSTENFGYMAGLIKDFLERRYYPCLEETEATPYSLFIKAGQDGQGTISSMQRIITGLKWKEVQAPLLCVGALNQDYLAACEELGMSMAAGLEAGIY